MCVCVYTYIYVHIYTYIYIYIYSGVPGGGRAAGGGAQEARPGTPPDVAAVLQLTQQTYADVC